MSVGARALVEGFERSVDPQRRRAAGVHYTPRAVAELLVREAIAALGRVPERVWDPSCGAGSFLLAAADVLHQLGVPAAEVVERRLIGSELDPDAATTAREVLRRWAADHGAPDAEPRAVQVGDSLDGVDPGPVDLVVGNPPFLGQLSSRTARSAAQRDRAARRTGTAVGYADTASLFLQAALDTVREGGVVAMLQPQSFLAARDSAPVRAALRDRGQLVSLWSSDDRLFDASVRVCAPVLRRGGHQGPVRILRDAGRHVGDVEMVPAGSPWGPLLAGVHGIPHVPPADGPTVAASARATAGFRDEYYALRDAAVETSGGTDAEGPAGSGGPRARLLTVGMVEPGWHDWGVRSRRLGGRMHLRPQLDPVGLAASSDRVRRWVAARRVPKVLVATQTRVVEAVADPTGRYVPVTPLISVEPHDPADVWALTAALLAPPVAAGALSRHLGTGLSAQTMRWSASAVLEVPLPAEDRHWQRGAALCRQLAEAAPDRRDDLLERLGGTMCRAHRLDPDHPVQSWWLERVQRR